MNKLAINALQETTIFRTMSLLVPDLLNIVKKFFLNEDILSMISKILKNDKTPLTTSTCEFLEKTWYVTPVGLQLQITLLIYLKIHKDIRNFNTLVNFACTLGRNTDDTYDISLTNLGF